MAFKDFPAHAQSVELLQRSLERGRLGHAYLFTGHDLGTLEAMAKALAKTLNCLHPITRSKAAIDCCDRCLNCRKVDDGNHADLFWVRPESKLRQIKINQIVRRDDSPPRVLLDAVNLKPTESRYKIGVIVAADRMNDNAANALLKTLEEPPSQSLLLLLSIEPERLLETILSRCLRLNFGGEGLQRLSPAQLEWVTAFSQAAAVGEKSLLGRYRLLDVLLTKLSEVKEAVEESLSARSPLEKYDEADEDLRERWEKELKAAVEAEYRHQRGDFIQGLQWWLRDVWLQSLANARSNSAEGLLAMPEMEGTQQVAQRLTPKQALENLKIVDQLQRWLHTNAQEALALEVGLLKLQL